MVFRNPQALSSALAALGTLQPRAFGFLNTVDPLVSVSNYYLLNDVIEPVTSACSVGPGGDVRTIHTGGLHSTVPLVWGSLRLTPISLYTCTLCVHMVPVEYTCSILQVRHENLPGSIALLVIGVMVIAYTIYKIIRYTCTCTCTCTYHMHVMYMYMSLMYVICTCTPSGRDALCLA